MEHRVCCAHFTLFFSLVSYISVEITLLFTRIYILKIKRNIYSATKVQISQVSVPVEIPTNLLLQRLFFFKFNYFHITEVKVINLRLKPPAWGATVHMRRGGAKVEPRDNSGPALNPGSRAV